ncbi:MAG: hypothetical protein AAFP69_03095 [Planctomycetota bacterium]
MTQTSESPKPSTGGGPPARHGGVGGRFRLIFRGCLILLTAGGLLLLMLGVGAYVTIRRQVSHFSSETAAPLPRVAMNQREIDDVRQQMQEIQQQLQQPESSLEKLVLTADEINRMIATDRKLSKMLFVRIENDQLGGTVSVPADQMPGGKGRFINADVTVQAELIDGSLHLSLDQAKVDGEIVPDWITAPFRGRNLAAAFNQLKENRKLIERFQSVEIRDGKVILQ